MQTDTKIKTETKEGYFIYKDNISYEYLTDYIKKTRGKTTKSNIQCVYAENHKNNDKNPSMGYDKKTHKYHCFTCDKWANIYDFIKIDYKITTDAEAFSILKNLYPTIQHYGYNIGQNITPKLELITDSIEINTDYNFTDIIEKSNNILLDSKNHITDKGIDADYMIGNYGYKYYNEIRGFTDETIKKFKLSAVNELNDMYIKYPTLQNKSKKQNLYKLILPILDDAGNCYNFIAEICNRDNIDEYNSKYKKPPADAGLTTLLFNEYYLKTDKPNTIFITEGIYDAISIEQLGYKAMALNGIGDTRLINLLNHYKPNINIILMLDNDTTGIKHSLDILNKINSLNIQNIKCIDSIQILSKYLNLIECKDANDMLLKDDKLLKAFLTENYNIININEDTIRINNANISNNLDYFKNIQNQPAVKVIPTGFNTLDTNLKGGLRTSLYVLGAISSLGKTAFLLQIADQIATAGYPVLYFSLEMDKKELIARSIARNTYKLVDDKTDKTGTPIASTTYDILDNIKYNTYSKNKTDTINTAIGVYENGAKNLYIISGRYTTDKINKRMDINNIEKIIKDFIQYKGITPIIFIDYIQILAPLDVRTTDKQNMDEVVDRLKQLSNELDTPVIAISSYNRDNYYEPANMSAFKESGSIEYGADYVIALQYAGIKDIYYGKTYKTDADKKRAIYELIENYKKDSYNNIDIPIEFIMLKARNSTKFNMQFNVNYTYGYFKEDIFTPNAVNNKYNKATTL